MKKFSGADLKAYNVAVAKIRAGGDWALILKKNGIEKKLVANGRYCLS
jgi:hypothetical protein